MLIKILETVSQKHWLFKPTWPPLFYIAIFPRKRAIFFPDNEQSFLLTDQWISQQVVILGCYGHLQKQEIPLKKYGPCHLAVIISEVYLTDSFGRHWVLTHALLATCSSLCVNAQSAAALPDNHYSHSILSASES